MADVRIFLTSGSSWTVPADCISAAIECIGGGAGGVAGHYNYGWPGGGGGAYSKKNSLALTPGDSVSFQIGSGGGSNSAGGDTWFKSTSDVLAKGAEAGNSSDYNYVPKGGQASDGVGDVKYSGGNGGLGQGYGKASGGGGGAAGLNADGNNGLTGTNVNGWYGGAGGRGDGIYGGLGGAQSDSWSATPVGQPGTEWDSTHGSGGGGTGTSNSNNGYNGGAGGLYGGGGGGAGFPVSRSGGSGRQGLIVITYSPVATGSSKFFQLF